MGIFGKAGDALGVVPLFDLIRVARLAEWGFLLLSHALRAVLASVLCLTIYALPLTTLKSILEFGLRLQLSTSRLFISGLFTAIAFSILHLVCIVAEIAIPRLHCWSQRSIFNNKPLILTPTIFNHFHIDWLLFEINGWQIVNLIRVQFYLNEHGLETETLGVLEVLELLFALATPFTLQTVHYRAFWTFPHRYFLGLRFTSLLLTSAEDTV